MGGFINPVISGFNPDPSICRKGDTYYLATSSFEYFPGVPIYKSIDLVNWDLVCNSLYTKKSLDLNNCGDMSGIYAPTLRYHKGVFYMITTNTSGVGHLFVTTTDIESGIWSEPVFVEGRGFDPDLFFDDDGKVYFSREDFGGFGILTWEIDIETGLLIGEGHLIWSGFEDKLCEAPHLYKINGMYYLLVAEGGTYRGHMVVVARSSYIFGPYSGCPDNPILTHRHHVDYPIQSCGHGDMIQALDGKWWIVFLATRPNGNFHHLGRETFLAPVEWDYVGWPHINMGNPIEQMMDCPGAGERLCDKFEINYSFANSLSPHLNFRRNPRADTYYLCENRLLLKLDEFEFGDINHRSFLGMRQKHFNFRANAQVELDQKDSGQAGICVVMSDNQFYSIALLNGKEEIAIVFTKKIYDIHTISKTIIKKNTNIGIKPETKTADKTVVGTDVKTDIKTDPKTEVQTEVQTYANSNDNTDTKTHAKADIKTDIEMSDGNSDIMIKIGNDYIKSNSKNNMEIVEIKTEQFSKYKIRFIIVADKDYYYFYYENRGEKIYVGKGLTRLLSAECGATFTGVYVGMFATGNTNGDVNENGNENENANGSGNANGNGNRNGNENGNTNGNGYASFSEFKYCGQDCFLS